MKYFVKSKSDENSFYRSIMSSYILILIDKYRLPEFISFLKYSTTTEDTYCLKRMPLQVDLVYRILKSILNIGDRTQKAELAYIAFYLFVNLNQDFDQNLIVILREFLHNFIKANPDFASSDRNFRNFLKDQKITLLDYSKNYINKMNVEPKEFIFALIPFVLKVNLKIYNLLLSPTASLFLKKFEFNISNFIGECPKTPDLNKEEISLLQRQNHYDYLLSSINVNITKLKKYASVHIKQIEEMYEYLFKSMEEEEIKKSSSNIVIPENKEQITTNVHKPIRGRRINAKYRLQCGCEVENLEEFYNQLLKYNKYNPQARNNFSNFICPNCRVANSGNAIQSFFLDYYDLVINHMHDIDTKIRVPFCIICRGLININEEKNKLCHLHSAHTDCTYLPDNFLNNIKCPECKKILIESPRKLRDYLTKSPRGKKNEEESDIQRIEVQPITNQSFLHQDSKDTIKSNEGTPLNLSNFEKLDEYECCYCDSINTYLLLECHHSVCKNCTLITNKSEVKEYFSNTYFCNKCKKRSNIQKIFNTCNCQIKNFSKYILELNENLILNNNLELLFECPICNQSLLNEELKYFFGTKNYEKKMSIIHLLQKEMQSLFISKSSCNFCNKSSIPSIKLYDCKCPPTFICFNCLKKFHFKLSNFLSKCPICGNSGCSPEIKRLFQLLSNKEIMENCFGTFKDNIINSINEINKLNVKEEGSPTILKIETQRESPRSESAQLKTVPKPYNDDSHTSKFQKYYNAYALHILARMKNGCCC